MRDLQNKLKSSLLNASYVDFEIQDFTNLCNKISEGGKAGKLDIKLIMMFLKRCPKTLCYVPNSTELHHYVEFYDTVYRLAPLVFAQIHTEVKLILSRVNDIQKN